VTVSISKAKELLTGRRTKRGTVQLLRDQAGSGRRATHEKILTADWEYFFFLLQYVVHLDLFLNVIRLQHHRKYGAAAVGAKSRHVLDCIEFHFFKLET
jgi:hypothetical protein